jgi:N-methylhydantoinase A
VPLDEAQVRRRPRLFRKRGIRSVIVCFLFSFLNDSHEKRAKEIVEEVLSDAYICCSSEVVNVIREYERFSTAGMNAYIGPKTALYLRRLEDRLRENGVDALVRIMQSNGGISTVENSSARPVGLLLSGPAGGVIGGRWTGEACETGNVITIDIGGTSADISVIQNGELRIKNPRDTEVASLPVLVPMIDIDAIGAGGGSIAHIDPGGAFRVGPRSAGADPGPACYGKGGVEPTVTDAQVVLGRLDPEHFLGGDLKIEPALAHKAIEEHIARPLGLGVRGGRARHPARHQQQHGAGHQRQLGRQGHRPAQLHADGLRRRRAAACDGAGRDHQPRDVIAPLHPGITAAMGLLLTDLQYEFTRSVLMWPTRRARRSSPTSTGRSPN